MPSTKRIGFTVVNLATGAAENASSLTLLWWDPVTGNTSTPPDVTAHGSGRYSFDASLPADTARAWAVILDTGHGLASGGQVAHEDQQQPVTLGAGSQTVTLSVTVDGGAAAGVRLDVRSSGSLVAQAHTGADGTAVLYLDPGTYSVTATRPGAAFPSASIVVTSPNTATPSTIAGTAVASTSTTPEGLTGTASWTAPTLAGRIGPLTARDSWAITRTLSALPDDADSVAFTVRPFGASGPSLVVVTAVVSGTAVTVTIAAGALDLPGGTYAYDLLVTLDDGQRRAVEVGTIVVTEHPTP